MKQCCAAWGRLLCRIDWEQMIASPVAPIKSLYNAYNVVICFEVVLKSRLILESKQIVIEQTMLDQAAYDVASHLVVH